MKLRNKKTGEIVILIDHIFDNYNSLTELTDEWEDDAMIEQDCADALEYMGEAEWRDMYKEKEE